MIWFDLDNSPHVPLIKPIIDELKLKNITIEITARDFAQTISLLKFWNIPHTEIGLHGGKNKLKKIFNLFTRSYLLHKYIRNKNIKLAVSHGSRTQVLTAWSKGIPSVLMLDYEYTESKIFNLFATYLLIPKLIPDERLIDAGFNLKKVIRYPGFKEEIYLKYFVPQLDFRKIIGIDESKILVTIRPPSIVGNYHDNRSEIIFFKLINILTSHPDVHCLIISRLTSDFNLIPESIRNKRNISFLEKTVDGLQLIWNSDIVISGGGTMNREAALLGIPTFSIFTGRKPYLDEYLARQGKIVFLNDLKDIEKLEIKKRNIKYTYHSTNINLVNEITDIITDIYYRTL